jgi:hypothetical protein
MNKKEAASARKFNEFARRLNDLCRELNVELDKGNAEIRLITPTINLHIYKTSDVESENWRANDEDRENKMNYYGARLY